MEKLKTILSVLALTLCLSSAAVATTYADSSVTDFACQDGSTGLNIKNGSSTVVVTCKSGAKIDYLNYDSETQSAVTLNCPSGQTVGDAVDAPNQATSKITFYCAITHGTGDNGSATRTKSRPTAKQTAAPKATPAPSGNGQADQPAGQYHCGGGQDSSGKDFPSVTTSINFGCTGRGNPIIDLTFAIVRFLSAGVGLVIVGSIVVAGIQYSSSRGDPQAVAAAQARIRSTVGAFLLFIFAYAILNYIIPIGFFHQ